MTITKVNLLTVKKNMNFQHSRTVYRWGISYTNGISYTTLQSGFAYKNAAGQDCTMNGYGSVTGDGILNDIEIIPEKFQMYNDGGGNSIGYVELIQTFEMDYGAVAGGFHDLTTSPLTRSPDISAEWVDVEEVMEKDFGGNVVANSLGEKYSDPEMMYQPSVKWVIQRNVSSNPSQNLLAFSKTTNSGVWNTIAAEKVLINAYGFRMVNENYNGTPIKYYTETIELIWKTNGWRTKRLNTSFTINATTKTPKEIYINANGTLASSPVYYPDNGYQKYQSTDWTSLQLPNPLTA